MAHRPFVALVAILLATVGFATFAHAATEDAEALTVRVDRVELEPDGTSRLLFSVTGLPAGASLEPGDLTVVENGVAVRDLEVAPLSSTSEEVTPAVILAVDTSESTAGEPIALAVAAGQELVSRLDDAGTSTGVIGFGRGVAVLARLDEPAGASSAALGQLVARGSTPLYDAIARASRLLGEHEGPRDLVIFSDGIDNGSNADLATARALALAEDVRVTAVVLQAEQFDVAPLEAIARATGGSLTRVADPELLLATFTAVAEDLSARYEARWTTPAVPVQPGELGFAVRLTAGGATASDEFVALNPRLPAITEPVPYRPIGPPIPLLGSTPGLVVAFVSVFLSVLLISGLTLSGAGERRRRERLAARLEGWDGVGDAPDDAVVAAASLSERAADAVDRLPKPSGMEERLASLLERADWPMRPSEFQLMTVATLVGGFVVPLVLVRNVPVALVGLMAGGAGPWLFLRFAVARRGRAFEDQLPSVLSLLAGALRAGHSFHTALEGTIRETDEPAHSELRRAAVEHRLGRPIAESLRGVADRLQSDDLRWVVTAISIQQDVGGNLAELLDNVAATLRDRASLVRTVRALSAEGRISAWIIGAMPFAMFVVMSVINADYTALLYTTGLGRAMLVMASVMLVGGIVWLRNIVQPRY